MTSIAIIAAVDRQGGIGRDNALLWHEPQDQQHFRRTTMGCPVIMGRRTWDSLPDRFRPLPGRRNLVVSRNPALQLPGAEVVAGLDDALARLGDTPRAFVIGGAALYALALPRADTLVLTEIDATFDADVHFPAWDRGDFVERSRESHVTSGGTPFAFVTYERRPR